MKQSDVKEFIRVQCSKRWTIFWELKRELFKPSVNTERLVYLSREFQRIDHEISEAKKLLTPHPFIKWVRSLK